MRKVVLHVDRLVLHGIEHGAADALSTALQAELAERLASAHGLAALTAHSGVASVQAGAVRGPSGATPAALGRAIAARITTVGAKR